MQCVKSAPSTSMTSVQQWLHWVSDVESLSFVSWGHSLGLSHPPVYTGSSKVRPPRGSAQ